MTCTHLIRSNKTTCWKANANMVQRVLMVPTWLWRLLVSNMHDGAAEATLGRDWGYTLCLCGHGERWQRRWFTYKANWTTCRDNKFNKLRICRLTTDTTTSMLIGDREWSVNKHSNNIFHSMLLLSSKKFKKYLCCCRWPPAVCRHQTWRCTRTSRTSFWLC